MKKRVYLVLLILTSIIPLGLLTNAPAWGEWDKEYYNKILGFIPQGVESAKDISTPLKDYSFSSLNDVGSYYLSAVLGMILIFAFFYISAKVFNAKNT